MALSIWTMLDSTPIYGDFVDDTGVTEMAVQEEEVRWVLCQS